MGKRRENRAFINIRVRVTGNDYNGNPFSQTAQTVNVSITGAHLSGIHCLRGTGETVTIECGSRSAAFRVVWVGVPGTAEDGHFGVKALQPEKNIFKVNPGPQSPDNYIPPEKRIRDVSLMPPALTKSEPWDRSERRGAYRTQCTGTGQIIQPGVAYPIWAKVSDLSMGGCYLELIFSMARYTVVELTLTVLGRTFSAKGVIVTSDPGVGVGVKFKEVDEKNRKVLVELLTELRMQMGLGQSPGV